MAIAATRADIEAAARAVGAYDFISALPSGFDTSVGEAGGTLSQGQRQLVALARAVVADPRIFILDEATASIDSDTESRLQHALEELLKDRTALVIAHRLSTIREADRILVLKQGKLVEQGTHEELIRAGGLYAKLHELQFSREHTPQAQSGEQVATG